MMSACGVVCSECPAYLAAARGIAHQRQTADAWRRIYHLQEMPEAISCGGCLGPDDELFHTMGRCEARRCCRASGFRSCAECAVEGCPDLERAQAAWDSVPGLAATLSMADFERYARPYCGHRERVAAMRAARSDSNVVPGGSSMSNLILTLTGLAAIAFLVAVIAALFTGPIMAIPAEGFSRASTNLALLAIAVALLPRRGATTG